MTAIRALLAAAALAVSIVAVGMSSAVSGLSQAPQLPSPTPPTFRTEANYVRVDAFPTHDGQPVLDLTQEDFEILEGSTPQKVEQFEHVTIRAVTPQDAQLEPNTVRDSRAFQQNPRARVFVVFLDVGHVEVDGSHRIRAPLIKALDSLIGADDLVAVMTPDMSPTDLTFARKRTTIEGFLNAHWNWGERGRINSVDPQEDLYKRCFPGEPHRCPDGSVSDDRGVADAMIARRREKMTIDALGDLVTFLRGAREERKAVIAISDGWLLFRPDPGLSRKLNCQIPTLPQGGFDPQTGKLSAFAPADPVRGQNPEVCDRDRLVYSNLNDEQAFRQVLDSANRANTSFYPIDPPGLAVFDTSIAEDRTGLAPADAPNVTPPSVDQAMLAARINSLRTLAEATDGLAIVNSSDLDKGFKRIIDDLSSYYLLGYYSTGKLDGRFHSLTVRVKRPGVAVRARRGYLAAKTATPSVSPEAAATTAMSRSAEAAIAPLSGYARDVPLRLLIAAGWKPGDTGSAQMWIVGELGSAAATGDGWAEGFEVTAALLNGSDTTVATGRATVARNLRLFKVALVGSPSLPAGDYTLSVSARASSASIPTRETMHVAIPEAPVSVGALYLRRGNVTGNKDTPTADLRFHRSETIRVEVPSASSDAGTARLLDRTGKPLAVPVTAAVRDDRDGSRWRTAQLALAPLAPGEYIIEIAHEGQRALTAFKVVP